MHETDLATKKGNFMVRTAHWKYIYYEAFPPQLFDPDADSREQHDLSLSPAYVDV
jgi:hypothetical protein